MKIIEELSSYIEDEIKDARKYAEFALMHKDDQDDLLADLFYKISGQELDHINMIHGAAVALIEKYRKEHGNPPPDMQAVYDYLHERQIRAVAEIKVIRAMIKE